MVGRKKTGWVVDDESSAERVTQISNWERGLVQAIVETSCMRVMRRLEGSNSYSCLEARAVESNLGMRESSSNNAECHLVCEEADEAGLMLLQGTSIQGLLRQKLLAKSNVGHRYRQPCSVHTSQRQAGRSR